MRVEDRDAAWYLRFVDLGAHDEESPAVGPGEAGATVKGLARQHGVRAFGAPFADKEAEGLQGRVRNGGLGVDSGSHTQPEAAGGFLVPGSSPPSSARDGRESSASSTLGSIGLR